MESGNRYLGSGQDQGATTAPTVGEGCELPLNFDIGSAVRCRDGRCGRLVKVVVDPVTENVTDLIVERGFLQRHDRVVPISTIKQAMDNTIVLDISSDRLETYREYRERDFRPPLFGFTSRHYSSEDVRYSVWTYRGLSGEGVVPARGHQLHEGVSLDAKVIGHGTKVIDSEGEAGQVDHVLVGCEEGHITHLVVQLGRFGGFVIVPVTSISSVEDKGVRLSLDRGELEGLPRYEPG
jgi:sporulation protein YlmC with PRC-barrel domain